MGSGAAHPSVCRAVAHGSYVPLPYSSVFIPLLPVPLRMRVADRFEGLTNARQLRYQAAP